MNISIDVCKAVIAGVCALCTGVAQGQTLPTGFTATPLATVSGPTCMVVAPNGRVYIGEQGGAVRMWDPTSGLQAAAVHTFAVNAEGERGLIGIELDPGFASNGLMYAHVSRSAPTIGGSIRRMQLNTAGTAVVAGSETEIFYIGDYSSASNHNGGALHFGIDRKLYASVGDNGDGSSSQSLNNRFGKILRLNADGSIPTDNPTSFAGVTGAPTGNNRAIWALGLRNPFTFAIQPGTGRLFINDVGNGTWEEVNDGGPGRNFGWAITEGPFTQASFPAFTHPLVWYHHSDSSQSRPPSPNFTGFAITGGVFYSPVQANFPSEYVGDYFFGDLGGWIRRFDPVASTVTVFATSAGAVVDLRVDAQGRLLMLERTTESLRRIEYTAACRADFNGQNGVSVQDIFDFLAAYFASQPQANFNGTGGLSVQDIFDFLAAYFTAC